MLSFNTWGLPIAPRCSQRLAHLSTLFPSYDLLCLQEVSTNRDVRQLIHLAATKGLPYAHQFRQGVGFPVWNGITAPGLLILSRYPIVEVALLRFPVNGLLQRFDHSDWVAAKGVGLVRVDVSAIRSSTRSSPADPPVLVDVFVTHLHANYSNHHLHYAKCYSLAPAHSQLSRLLRGPDFYLPHRVAQAFHLSQFFATHRHPHHLAVLCGDLNAPPYDIVLHLIQALTGLHDAHTEKGGAGPGYTCGAWDNRFSKYAEAVARGEPETAVRLRHSERSGGERDTAERSTRDERDVLHETPKRIDYCLFSLPTAPAPSAPSSLPFVSASARSPSFRSPIALTQCEVVKPTMELEGKRYSLSDHHGVSATFILTPSIPSEEQRNGGSPQSQATDRLTLGPPRLSLDLSPPASPVVSKRWTSATAAVTPASAVASSPSPPSLITLLGVAMLIISSGIRETQERRRQHWQLSARAALLFLFLTATSALHPEGTFASALRSTVERAQLLHSMQVEWLLWLVLGVGGLVRGLSGLCAVLVLLIAQFPSKEEEMALMETLAEMTVLHHSLSTAEALPTPGKPPSS